jgi:hypothetical protein
MHLSGGVLSLKDLAAAFSLISAPSMLGRCSSAIPGLPCHGLSHRAETSIPESESRDLQAGCDAAGAESEVEFALRRHDRHARSAPVV